MGCVLYRNRLSVWFSGAWRSHLTPTEDKRRRPEEVGIQSQKELRVGAR